MSRLKGGAECGASAGIPWAAPGVVGRPTRQKAAGRLRVLGQPRKVPRRIPEDPDLACALARVACCWWGGSRRGCYPWQSTTSWWPFPASPQRAPLPPYWISRFSLSPRDANGAPGMWAQLAAEVLPAPAGAGRVLLWTRPVAINSPLPKGWQLKLSCTFHWWQLDRSGGIRGPTSLPPWHRDQVCTLAAPHLQPLAVRRLALPPTGATSPRSCEGSSAGA